MHLRLCLFLIFFLMFYPSRVLAVSINSPVVNKTAVPVYEKVEVKFNVDSQAKFPFLEFFNSTAIPGLSSFQGKGITVEGLLTTPSGKNIKHPAFYMTEVTRTGSGSNALYTETNKNYWVLRFSPLEVGTYVVKLQATDSSGTATSTVGNITATTPTKKGFVQVSKSDSKYFEYTNGDIYWPIGPAWLDRGTYDYANYKDTGVNLERPWMGGKGAYSSNWARWWSSLERHGNEGVTTHLAWNEKDTDSDLSYELTYPNGSRYWLSEYHSNNFYTNFKSNTKYTIKLRYKNVNVQGPRVSGRPYGLTVKIHETLWGQENATATTIDLLLLNKPQMFNHLNQNSVWLTFEGTFTTPASLPGTDLSVMLDNVTSGNSYISEFSVKECLDISCTSLGGEIIRNSKSDIHTYVDQRAAAYFDWQVEQAEKNGIHLKYVVHDKNDWIQSHLKANGTWANEGDGYYQGENTKARWLLRQWYRYLVARYGYSTAVFAWELNNEGPPNEEGNGTAAHWETAEAFAKYIKSIDAHPHLATTSFWCCWRPVFWGNSTKFPSIDYADIHDYISTNGDSTVREFSGTAVSYLDIADWKYKTATMVKNSNVNKPTLIGETGLINTSWVPLPELQVNNSGVWFHNMLWVELADAVVYDFNVWFPEILERFDRTKITKPFYDFVKTLDYNKGGYTALGTATLTDTNLRVYGQKNLNNDRAVLWIQNKSHTWRNVLNNPNGNYALSGTITFKMNNSKSYPILFYNTFDGSTIKTQNLTSTINGDLVISLDNLSRDVAIKVGNFTTTPQPTATPNVTPTVSPTVNPTPSADTNDLNNDLKVDILDVLDLVNRIFNSSFAFLNPNANPDINRDNTVNLLDIVTLIQIVFGVSPTPTQAPTPTPTPKPNSTPTVAVPTPTITPIVSTTPVPIPSGTSTGWTQHGANAQRTSYVDTQVTLPWSWKWSFNGSNASGGVVSGKFRLPRGIQPIIGDSKVYVSAGSNGVFGINLQNGSTLWQFTQATVNSSVAYSTGFVYALGTNGTLYKINAINGSVVSTFNTQSTSNLPLAVGIQGNSIFVAMGFNVYAINKDTLQQIWRYQTGGSNVATPPAYSASRNKIVVVTEDLYVHAINNTNGTQSFRVKPTPRNAGNPGSTGKNLAEATYGWPVIADNHGYVLIKYRLDWETMWTFNTWPTSNTTIRSNLQSNPGEQALYVVSLDNGSVPFIANIGHGGWGNGGYMPMGPMPVVKNFSNGEEVVYTVIRGDNQPGDDGRSDSQFGEMVLDNNTISGLQAGYVRWIQYCNYGWEPFSNCNMQPTDEQPFVSMAGNHLFGAHWIMGMALNINDRSASRGSYSAPITSNAIPNFAVVSNATAVSGGFSTTHYTPNSFASATEGEWRALPYGFYIYWNQGRVYDNYWNSFASFVIGENTVIFTSTDGSVNAVGR